MYVRKLIKHQFYSIRSRSRNSRRSAVETSISEALKRRARAFITSDWCVYLTRNNAEAGRSAA